MRKNFKIYLRKVLNSLPEDFDCIRLEYIDKNHREVDPKDVPKKGNIKINYHTKTRPGSALYIVSRKGAKYFLKLNEPILFSADGVFDPIWQICNKMPRLSKTYYVKPRLAWQGKFKSFLGD